MEPSQHDMIKEAVDKMSQKFPNEDKKKYTDLLSTIFEGGVLPQDAMGISDAFVEMLYAYAYKLFQAGKFEEASTAYKYLMTICPFDVRHPMALAACFHKMHNYTGALSTYIMATVLAPDSPMPWYHASDCMLKLNDLTGAIYMLDRVLEKAKNNPDYAALKERAEMSIGQLQKQLETIKR